ncbi:MAG: sigma-70 family RNA polymerase sigma factor [Acidobacteria bacterium]|nr:sigma-70 family RNA polymerase sigma factor [Acidobacteriota bacterium]
MQPGETAEITQLLRQFRGGAAGAESALIEAVQTELKAMAARYMRRERHGHTLQTTALMNEAYMKLVQARSTDWHDRVHFFAVAARVMRRILVDHARRGAADKRGGDQIVLPLNEGLVFAPDRPDEMVRLDDALNRLAAEDKRSAQVIELRFFGGLSVEETAEAMGISPRTVKREWNFARAWLRRELGLSVPEDGQEEDA